VVAAHARDHRAVRAALSPGRARLDCAVCWAPAGRLGSWRQGGVSVLSPCAPVLGEKSRRTAARDPGAS
jgi:hypothetical protein